MNRSNKIIRTSIVGIIANVFLAGFKAFVGIVSHSVAITMDAVNNLSDALSSLITIIGTKLADKEPDRKHPYGYGRIEYLSAMIIGVIILYAGLTSFIESINKIIHPETPDYSTASLVIVAAAIVVKIMLGLFTKKSGEKLESDSLVASGKDSLNDSILSASTLVAAIIFLASGISIEAYVGTLISLIIIKAGFETLRDTISEVLGERIPAELSKNVKKSIKTFEQVNGVYDLVVHNYGNDKLVGSAHIEVLEDMTAAQLDKLERAITKKVLIDTGVSITGISVYSMNKTNPRISEAQKEVHEIISHYEYVMQMHGFYVDHDDKEIKFDVVIDFEAPNKREIQRQIAEEVNKKYKDYSVQVNIDFDYSD